MAEAFSFELKLVDAVTSIAKKQTDALKKVELSAKKANDVMSGKQMASFGKQFEKVGFAAERAAIKQHKAFADSWSKIGMAAMRAQQRQHKEAERMAEKAKEHSLLGGIKEGVGFSKLTSAAFLGSALAEGAASLVESFIEGAHKAVELLTEGVTKAFEESGKQETLRLGEKLSLGKGAGEFREDVGRFSKITGFDDDVIRGMLLPLRRAGFDQKGARSSFAGAADIAAGLGKGGDAGTVNSVLDTLTHIKLKGGIGEKQLVGLGVDPQDIYKDIAKQLHISKSAAEKKVTEGGGKNGQAIINSILRGVEKKQGGELGTGAIAYSKTFEARLAKVKNLPNEYLKGLVDSPAFARASDMLGGLLEALDPESASGQRIMASLEKAFGRIGDLLQDPQGLVDGIADGIENLIGLVEQLLPDLRMMGSLLASAAQTTADLVTSARLFAAIQSGDTKATAAILAEQTQGRVLRAAQRLSEENASVNNTAAAVNVVAMTTGMPISASSGDGGKRGGKVIHMHVNAPVTVHGTDEETGKKAGRAVHREMVTAHERAAQEGG